MCSDRCGRRAGWPLIALFPLLVLTGGCAHQSGSGYGGSSGYYAGVRNATPPAPIPAEVEEDGRPPQLPPRIGVAAAPDDPSEPYSPNYGGPARPAPAKPAPAAAKRAAAEGQPQPADRVAWATEPE